MKERQERWARLLPGVVEENVYHRYKGAHRQSQLKGSRWYLHRERHNTTPGQPLKHHLGLRHLLEPRQPAGHFIKAATTCLSVSLLHFICLHKIMVAATLELKAIISRKTLLVKELQTLMKCHSVTPLTKISLEYSQTYLTTEIELVFIIAAADTIT